MDVTLEEACWTSEGATIFVVGFWPRVKCACRDADTSLPLAQGQLVSYLGP